MLLPPVIPEGLRHLDGCPTVVLVAMTWHRVDPLVPPATRAPRMPHPEEGCDIFRFMKPWSDSIGKIYEALAYNIPRPRLYLDSGRMLDVMML